MTSVCRTSENCKSLVLQDKCNIEIFLSPAWPVIKQPVKAFNVCFWDKARIFHQIWNGFFNSLHAGYFLMLLLSSADFFQN